MITPSFKLTNEENLITFIEIEKSGKRTGWRKMLIGGKVAGSWKHTTEISLKKI